MLRQISGSLLIPAAAVWPPLLNQPGAAEGQINMAQEAPLITAIVMGLCLAFIFGAIANKLRISPLVGYLLAGVLVGPNTPGFQADSNLVHQLAEIGVILLMFGVGLHFSLKDLLSVQKIAIPGAVLQMLATIILGAIFGWAEGWSLTAGLVFGIALSTASTVVVLRALQERSLLETERGRIAVGWLVVEDLAMVLVLVLLPVFAGHAAGNNAAAEDPLSVLLHITPDFGTAGLIIFTLAKVAVFIAVMMLVGRRVIPWILKLAAQTGSRELFSLSVLAIALGVAYGSAQLFGVSLALGAFFAGMIMSESNLSQRAARATLPLRDAFAVLFFVSVGMLFQPARIIDGFLPLLAALAIIFIGNSLAAYALMRMFGQQVKAALTLAAGLAQIGEFSFILAGFGNGLGLINDDARDYILGAAIISILLNPLLFAAAEKLAPRLKKSETEIQPQATAPAAAQDTDEEPDAVPSAKTGHIIIIGFNAAGKMLAQDLQSRGRPCLIIENLPRRVEQARALGFEVLGGNAAHEEVLRQANIGAAQGLALTLSNGYEAARIGDLARSINPLLHIAARAKTADDEAQLALSNIHAIVADSIEIAAALLRLLPTEAVPSGLAPAEAVPTEPALTEAVPSELVPEQSGVQAQPDLQAKPVPAKSVSSEPVPAEAAPSELVPAPAGEFIA